MPDSNSKLVDALSEIQAVLVKHDLGAIIILASKESLVHHYEFSPSWSCAKLEPSGGELTIRSDPSEFPSQAARVDCLRSTVGLISGLHGGLCHSADLMGNVILQLKSVLGAKPTGDSAPKDTGTTGT